MGNVPHHRYAMRGNYSVVVHSVTSPQPSLQLRGAAGAAVFELPELPGDGSELHKAVSLRDAEYAKAGIEVEVRDKVGDVLGTAVLPMRQHHQHAKKELLIVSTPEGDVRISLTSGWEFKQYGAGGIAIWVAYAVLLFCWLAPTVMLIPLWLNLITTATAIVFIGAHRSLRLLDHTHAEAADRETLSKEDAYKFPLVGSAVLFTLYIAYKFLPKDLLNRLITLYFALLGVYTMASTFSPAIAKLVPGTKKYGVAFKLPLVGEVDLRFTPAEWVALVLSSVFARYYIKTKHFLMNNLLAISFCVQGIGKLSLGSYTTAAILLVGLFAYDIFWVFGTDVMVSVAKSFDAPAKILFPQVFSPEDGPSKFALLGLGDIVIPGVFVALLWRFDAMIAHANPKTCAFEKFPSPYFTSNILAYAAGLGMTVFVMFFFEAAQPALLYLVPACLLSSLGMSFFRKELKLLLSYEEKDEEAEAQAAAAKDEANKPKSD